MYNIVLLILVFAHGHLAGARVLGAADSMTHCSAAASAFIKQDAKKIKPGISVAAVCMDTAPYAEGGWQQRVPTDAQTI